MPVRSHRSRGEDGDILEGRYSTQPPPPPPPHRAPPPLPAPPESKSPLLSSCGDHVGDELGLSPGPAAPKPCGLSPGTSALVPSAPHPIPLSFLTLTLGFWEG